jgi:glycosyltransferase involved in cell wall biosynthesis
MNITFITNQSMTSPSGLGRHLPLARGLSGLGHAVKIICLHHNLDEAGRLHYSEDGVDIEYAGQMHVKKVGDHKVRLGKAQLIRVLFLSSFGLLRHALRSGTDLFYLCKPQPINSPAALILKMLKSRPLVTDCDDYEAFAGNFENSIERSAFRFFEDNIPKYSDLITVNTLYLKKRYRQLGIAEEKILYLPNGVEPKRFNVNPALLEKLKQELDSRNRRIVLYFGSLDLKTGHPVDLLIRAFKIVVSKNPGCKLLLVGGGIDIEYLKSMAGELELNGNVIFKGRIEPEEIPAYIKLSDLCVDPADNDLGCIARCPLKLFEAMYMGVPNLTGNAGDRGYLLGQGRYGYLVEPGSEEALAAGILDALNDAGNRKRIAAAAEEYVKDFYWENLAKKYDEFIRARLSV